MMNIAKMMTQAKAMQGKMKELQEQMAEIEVVGEGGAGAVRITTTCKGECRYVEISPELCVPEKRENLEDFIKTAMNDAKIQADQKLADSTNALMREMGLPAGALDGGALPF